MADPERTYRLALTATFVLSLTTPPLATLLWPTGSVLPGEAPLGRPRALDRHLPEAFDAYFQSRFGLRRPLVAGMGTLDYLLGPSLPTGNVLVGHDGWLFLDHDGMPESITGAHPFSEDDLAAWVKAVRSCADHVATWGGNVLVVIVPNKATLHPDKLPPARPLARGPRRIDQLTDRLAAAGLHVLDLRETLRLEAEQHPVYGKLDTHWNGHGVLAGARAIAAEIQRLSAKLVPFDEASIVVETRHLGGDLAHILALPRWFDEPRPVAIATTTEHARRLSEQAVAVSVTLGDRLPLELRGLVPSAPGVVFHRDSFSRPLVPLLADRLSHSVWLWRREFDPITINRHRPDVVVVEVVERYLEGPPQQTRF